MKKVSVIIPVYGVEKFIAATVQSVLGQTYENFEILIVDDASPDNSVAVCEQFHDPRLRILRQANRGLAGARNTGIRHATGEYIAFLDGDDLWQPEKLAAHVAHLERSPEVGVSFSRSEFIDEAGASLHTYLMPKLQNITVEDLFRGSPIGNGSAAVLRREVLEAIAFEDSRHGSPEVCYFDEQFRRSEDIECWLRIVLQTPWKIEGLPEALTLYRVNAGGLSASLFKQLESWEQVLAKTRTYAPELVQRLEPMGMAYQYRYLARSAIRLKAASDAARLMRRSVTTYWPIVREEPKRTLLTFVAAHLLWLLPQPLYASLERAATQITGKGQKDQILKEQAEQAV